MIDQINSFLEKGFAIFNVPDLIDLSAFNIINVELNDDLINDFSATEQAALDDFVNYVSQNFVKSLYKDFKVVYYSIWDGVDQGSTVWHNDNVEGFDFNVLYYFDNTDPVVGGCIEFRYPDGEHKIYPKSGDLIFINQKMQFLHRASRSTAHRRVASIEYKVYE
jgi:hypothetical protein